MTAWHERAHEERHLINPAFCSVLLWHAGKGSSESTNSPRSSLSFNEAFLILPLVLHQKTRLNLLHFRGQGKKSYLPSKGDMRHDRERQQEPQEVQQRVQD